MSWITPRQALTMLGMKKLAQLTNEAGQGELIGVGDGVKLEFLTPFCFGSDVKVYGNGVVVGGYTSPIDYTQNERIKIVFAVAPAVDLQITASSGDCVNVVNLEGAMLRAQGIVRGMLDAQLYLAPADNATNCPEMISGWAAAIAWYLLATDPRRPRLIEAYPEFLRRYDDVYGAIDSDLKRVAKGNFSLRGILPEIDPDTTPGVVKTGFTSNPVVYTPSSYRGVQ